MSLATRPRAPRAAALGFAAGFLLFGCTSSPPTATTAPRITFAQWERLPDAPTARTEATAVAVAGRIHVIAGFDASGSTVETVEIYDPGSRAWADGPALPIAVNHAASAELDGVAYVVGGYLGPGLGGATDRAFAGDGLSWTELPPMPEVRAAAGAATADGRLYVVGGVGPAGLATSTMVFDPTGGTWAIAGGLGTPREHLGVAGFGERIYALGGRTGGIGSNLAAAEVFDPSTGRWQALPDLPTARGGVSAATANGLLVVPGGEAPEGTFPEVEAFDVAAGRWVSLPPLPTPRHGLGVAALGPVVFVITGGPQPGASFSSANEALDLGSLG